MLMKRHFSEHRQGGSSLLEVLVTMIVVALGLLGHASLIAVSAKDNHTAFMRSQATLLAYDIIERVRINQTLAKAGSFNIALGGAVGNGATIQLTELRDWRANIARALPSGDGSVNVDGSGNVTIVIQWSEVIKGATDGAITPTTFTTQTVI
jgi:type IV pilus assembly protein PilV